MYTSIQSDPEWKASVNLSDDAMTIFGGMLENELREALWAEKAILSAITQFSASVKDEELLAELGRAKGVIETLIEDLRRAFQILGEESAERTSQALDTHFRIAIEGLKKFAEGFAYDVCVVFAMQKGLHYNIAHIETLVVLSSQLGLNGAAAMFQPVLEEKRETQARLNHVALNIIARQTTE